ncbi:hypothetical protein GGQ68_004798 [Sagittula marina]|uniref:Uncharacterized protein n=1 Tax=Sagittula marina TaxID=943940 RepID=A0A7W6GUD2_9RHOB|nr:hypothetical protein [Sagittula marina]MBB3988441.1 hypothetical protein [Sagittula marina]
MDDFLDFFVGSETISLTMEKWGIVHHKTTIATIFAQAYDARPEGQKDKSLTDFEANALADGVLNSTDISKRVFSGFFEELSKVVSSDAKISIVQGEVVKLVTHEDELKAIPWMVIAVAAFAAVCAYGLYKHAQSRGFGIGGRGSRPDEPDWVLIKSALDSQVPGPFVLVPQSLLENIAKLNRT